MKTKGIIFDFGFTLFEFRNPSVERFFDCFNRGLSKSVELCKKWNIFKDEENASKFIKFFNKKRKEYFALSVKTKKEYSTSYIFRNVFEIMDRLDFGRDIGDIGELTENDYQELATLFHSCEEEEWIPFSETKQTLEKISKIKDLKLALLSNHPHHQAIKNMLKRYDIIDIFDVIVTSADHGCRKPDPEIFKHTLRKMGISNEDNETISNCIMCGDEYADIIGGQRAGLKTILFERTFKFPFEKEIPSLNLIKIKNISEILSYIE